MRRLRTCSPARHPTPEPHCPRPRHLSRLCRATHLAISKLRFDLLASYARSPLVATVGTEVEWFEAQGTPVIAALIFDRDGEYSATVLAPDIAHRYRGVRRTDFHDSAQGAVAELADTIADLLPLLEDERVQGDEERPIDFFAPLVPAEQLHPSFVQLTQNRGWAAARTVMEHIMRWYNDLDGNFVEQFQTTGFDPRIWEVYLFATLTESGYLLDRTAPMPDFVAVGPAGPIAVEATTANPGLLTGISNRNRRQKPKMNRSVTPGTTCRSATQDR